MKIIISGAISNDPDYMSKFERYEELLQYRFPEAEVFNPAAYCNELIRDGFIIIKNRTDKQIWLDCMCVCLPEFEDATHIYYIDDDNYTSDGKHIEIITAEHMGLEVIE